MAQTAEVLESPAGETIIPFPLQPQEIAQLQAIAAMEQGNVADAKRLAPQTGLPEGAQQAIIATSYIQLAHSWEQAATQIAGIDHFKAARRATAARRLSKSILARAEKADPAGVALIVKRPR